MPLSKWIPRYFVSIHVFQKSIPGTGLRSSIYKDGSRNKVQGLSRQPKKASSGRNTKLRLQRQDRKPGVLGYRGSLTGLSSVGQTDPTTADMSTDRNTVPRQFLQPTLSTLPGHSTISVVLPTQKILQHLPFLHYVP